VNRCVAIVFFIFTLFLLLKMSSVPSKYLDKRVTIRSLRPEDMERVTEMLQSVSLFSPAPSTLEALATKFLSSKKSHACVAEHDQLAIGFGSIFVLDRIRGGRSAVIEDVVVHESARRMGIGRLIVADLLEYAKTQECFKVSLIATDQNVTFYESLGFEKDLQNMRLSITRD
jgi:ribosomal protein S18 acetylase RimI-like enzyme